MLIIHNKFNRYLKEIKFRLACIFDRRLTVKLTDIHMLNIKMTNRCNAECKFCAPNLGANNKQVVRQDIGRTILYKFLYPLYKNLKQISLTGGEPTI